MDNSPTQSVAAGTTKPKSVKIISNLLSILAMGSFPAAFSGSMALLTMNKAGNSAYGSLEFSALKAMPFLGLVSIVGMIYCPLMLYCSLKIRSGSWAAWKFCFVVLIISFG